jgi:hypothetical protein
MGKWGDRGIGRHGETEIQRYADREKGKDREKKMGR